MKTVQGDEGFRLQMGLTVGAAFHMPAVQHGFGAQVMPLSINIRKSGYHKRAADAIAVDAAHTNHGAAGGGRYAERGDGCVFLQGARAIGKTQLGFYIYAIE